MPFGSTYRNQKKNKKRKRKDDCPSKNTHPEKNTGSISNDAYLDNTRLEKESPK